MKTLLMTFLIAIVTNTDGETNIVFTENVAGAGGLACFKIETPTATYFLEKSGAGLSSLIDEDGNDWISFNPQAGTGSSGEFRGFPNAVYQSDGSYFHPKNVNTGTSTNTVAYVGPERVTINAVSDNGAWACRYDFLATHCTFTMIKMPAGFNYWVLYEGTPGGQYDDTDWWMTSAQQQHTMLVNNTSDIPAPEWIVFGDPRLNRVLYLLHQKDDTYPDYFYQMDKQMTVFGFGRNGLIKYLNTVPQSVSIGFLETTNHTEISAAMNNLLLGESPKLDVAMAGAAEIALAWPRSSEGFNLQAAGLPNGLGWYLLTNAPVDVGTNWQVTLPVNGEAQFYRLIR